MIDTDRLTKVYGPKRAVDEITFRVRPGRVTGFLGPNGAGKSTTMRMLVGLDRPTSGHSTLNGKRYRDCTAPLREVGVLLDARSVHPGRSARQHLKAVAATHRIPQRRVTEVLGLAGLEDVADKRAGTFSLGMGQRLGMAVALLGDPRTLILDEPINGLDPEGVRWIRSLLRSFADEGRTILLSSHLMSEMAQTADHLIVLGQGRIVADDSVQAILARAGQGPTTRVRTQEVPVLEQLLHRAGAQTTRVDYDALTVTGLGGSRIAELAAEQGLILYEITPVAPSLEDAFFDLTRDSTEYASTAPALTSPTRKDLP